MHNIRFRPVPLASLLLMLVLVACGPSAPAATETPAATAVPPATATSTTPPTSTPNPTATPDVAATLEFQKAEENVNRYVAAGYFDKAQGTLYSLDDMQKELAKINYVDVSPAGYPDKVENFAVWATVKQESAAAVNYPEYSGCGFAFRYQDNGDHYYALLTKDRIVMVYCLASGGAHCGVAGKTRGPGTVKLGSPFEAQLELALNGNHAYVLVNGEFVGEYTLFADKLIDPGYLGYGMVSGTNKDYGTRCTMTDAKLWVPE